MNARDLMDQLWAARHIEASVQDQVDDPIAEFEQALREVWNARGAADIAKAENVLSERGMAAPMIWLDPALRSLDR